MKPKSIVELRHSLEKTQLEFSQIMGVSLGTVQSWEKKGEGQRNPPELAFRYARLLLAFKNELEGDNGLI